MVKSPVPKVAQWVLEIFKENKDEICLLWYWDTTMDEALKTNYPSLWEQVQEIVKNYKEQNWGIYVTEAKREEMIRLSAAYYGDGSGIAQEMVMAEKPVMLQNFEC